MNRYFILMRRFLIVGVIAACATVWSVSAVRAEPKAKLTVKILAVNDFHGQLSPRRDENGEQVGGAAYLAAYLRKAQAGKEDTTIIVVAGDQVGASRANSALLMDEPSIMFLNTLANPHCLTDKMDSRCNIVATLGNHEFDKGVGELKRKMNGGNYDNESGWHRIDAPYLENPYKGAHYPFVSANVVVTGTGQTLVPPYVIKTVRNVPIAFVGAVLKGTPDIVIPSAVAGLEFRDEAEAINSYVPEIEAKGVHAIVAVIHQGDQDGWDRTMERIVRKLDPAIGVVISAHTHKGYAKTLKNSGGKDVLVTQAWSYSAAYADIDLEIDPTTKEIVTKWANVAAVNSGVVPDPAVQKIVESADAMVEPLVGEVEGQAVTTITAKPNVAGESALGDLIADAERTQEGSDFAFMNPGGIRADLAAGPVTWGKLFDVLPFGNQMVTVTMTGQQIYDVLAQQWSNGAHPKILQVSGLTYQWRSNSGGRPGSIIDGSVKKNDGHPIDKALSYKVAMNDFLAAGGDKFSMFKTGRNLTLGKPAVDDFAAYVRILPNPFGAPSDAGKRVTLVR